MVFLLRWMLWTAVYLLFTGQFSLEQGAAAGVCGLAAALWSASLRGVPGVRLHFEKGAVFALGRAIVGLPSDTAAVAVVLCRVMVAPSSRGTAPGEVVREPFVRQSLLCAADAAYRAMAVLARSMTPDSFVVRTPEDRAEMDIHQLMARSAPKDARAI